MNDDDRDTAGQNEIGLELTEVKTRRAELQAAVLTIWRWGRLQRDVRRGRNLGSFKQWCRWVRDPLVELGCIDPVERISEAKQRDGRRQAIAELFQVWWQCHGDRPVQRAISTTMSGWPPTHKLPAL